MISTCLERTRRWMRLAFACLAIVAGALPAQAVADPQAQTTTGAVERPAASSRRAAARTQAVRAPRRVDPRRLASQKLRRSELRRRPSLREQGPPKLRFLVHRALLR